MNDIGKLLLVIMIMLTGGLMIEHSRLAIIPLLITVALLWKELYDTKE